MTMPAISDEIAADHFEAIRINLWQLIKEKAIFFGADVSEVYPAWSSSGTYAPGSIVTHESEIWITASNLVSDPTPPDESGAWEKAADWRKYAHYDHNARRYILSGDSGSGYNLIEAYKILPRQMIPTKQMPGPIGVHTWPKLYFVGDTVMTQPNNPDYLRCLETHVSDVTLNLDKWESITQAEAFVPTVHPLPVEFDINQITGVIGAIYPYPRNPSGGPPPWYYNYYLAPQNQPDNGGQSQKYYNPKVSTAYQAAVELYVSTWMGGWMGGTLSHETYPAHGLGDGIDPAVPTVDATCFNFNRSAFEELLYRMGRYDSYLDLNFSPSLGAGENGYDVMGCWRRTWKYTMNYPYGIDQTRRIYYLQMSELPDVSSYITIDGIQFQFDDELENPETYIDSENIEQTAPYEFGEGHVHVLIDNTFMGDNLNLTLANLAMAINASGVRAFAEDSGSLGIIKISVDYDAGTISWTSGTNFTQEYLFTTGGMYSMWPQEWGDPPQIDWRDPEALSDLIDDVAAEWNGATQDFRDAFIRRHTLKFEPSQTFDHAELIPNILSDMWDLLAYCQYHVFYPEVLAKELVWVTDEEETEPSFNTFEDAASYINGGNGQWQEVGDYGPVTWNVGFKAFLTSGPTNEYLVQAFATVPTGNNTFVRNITGGGAKLHLVDEELYNRGYRWMVLQIPMSPSGEGGWSGEDQWKDGSNIPYSVTLKYLTISMFETTLNCQQLNPASALGYVSVPIVASSGDNDGAIFTPTPMPSFYPHNYDLSQKANPIFGENCYGMAMWQIFVDVPNLLTASPRGISLT